MTYIIVTLGYILILAAIIIVKSRSVKNEEDFVVAGRNVPVYLLVGTLVTTWIGSGSLFGTAGLTFQVGFSELWFSLGAWVGILAVYFIAARVRRISQYTLTDILEKRYAPLARLLGTITIMVAYLIIAGYQFKGGGRFLSILTEGAISVENGTLITFLIIIAFTALAGMVSIVSIDIFNGIIMILAICIAVPVAINGFGGWGNVVETINQVSPDHLKVAGGHDTTWYFAIALPTLILLLSESSVYQKFSSAKDAKSAKKAVMGMFIGVVVIEVLMCVLAIVGFAIYSGDPRFIVDGVINKPMSEEIILRIGFEQLPAIVGSILFAGGAAIILSTGNTFLMVTSTNFSRDIIEKYFIKDASEKKKLIIQRVSICVLGFIAFLIMTQFEQILSMALISYTMIGAALAPALLATFFWKRVTKQGGIASILAGMLSVALIEGLNRSGSTLDLGFMAFPFDTQFIAIPALVASVSALIIVSLLTKPTPKEIVDPFFENE